MEVSGQLHAPAALPQGKEPLVPIGGEAGCALEPVLTLWNREKFCLCRESNPSRCTHSSTLKMDAVGIFETSLSLSRTTWRDVPEDDNLNLLIPYTNSIKPAVPNICLKHLRGCIIH
jgi:hypothetical protein